MHKLDFDTERFGTWLARQTGESATLTITPIRGGGSCEMFKMHRLGREWVIRRAPTARVSGTAHNVTREARIIRALHGSNVPVPEVLAASDDESLIGAPFFVMEFIDGTVIRNRLPEAFLDAPETQPAIGEELVDRLADLHDFDWQNSDIAALAKPQDFLQRQVDRWLTQLDGYRCREMPGVDGVADWLAAHIPTKGDLAVMHGDYKLDNVMFAKSAPPRIVSLLDFEMTTVGDPLIDLAWAIIFWPEEGNLIAMVPPGSDGGMSADNCQTPEQLIRRYGERTGRDLSHFQWYQAFSAWKLAIVLEASYAKFLSGESKNPMHQHFGFVVDELLKRARRFAV